MFTCQILSECYTMNNKNALHREKSLKNLFEASFSLSKRWRISLGPIFPGQEFLICSSVGEKRSGSEKMSRTKVPLFTTYFSYCQLGIALCYSLVWYSCCVYCATWISTWIKVVNQFFTEKSKMLIVEMCVCVYVCWT